MEFCRLIVLLVFLLASCTLSVDNTFVYHGYIIGEYTIYDKIILNVNEREKYRKFKILESSYIAKDSFVIVEHDDMLILKISSCNRWTSIRFVDDYVNNNKCRSIYPFFLESITLLDTMRVAISGKDYHVLKLSNESYTNSSAIFWLQGFGIILMRLEQGKCYLLKKVNNSDMPWEAILNKVVENLDFSELWPIPPLPPEPVIE